MSERLSPTSDDLILCQRKSFRESVSAGGRIFSVLTLGFGYLLLYGIYGLVPRQIWIRDSRVFADKILPSDGAPLDSAKVTVRTVTLAMSVEIARTVDVEFVAEGKRYLIAINRNYYPADHVERAVDFFSTQVKSN